MNGIVRITQIVLLALLATSFTTRSVQDTPDTEIRSIDTFSKNANIPTSLRYMPIGQHFSKKRRQIMSQRRRKKHMMKRKNVKRRSMKKRKSKEKRRLKKNRRSKKKRRSMRRRKSMKKRKQKKRRKPRPPRPSIAPSPSVVIAVPSPSVAPSPSASASLPAPSEEPQASPDMPIVDDAPLKVELKEVPGSLKIGRNGSRTRSYKVYVLQGRNIRHYRVRFRTRRRDTRLVSLQVVIDRCIRNAYIKECITLPLKEKIPCTDKVVKGCVGKISFFKVVTPKTKAPPDDKAAQDNNSTRKI